MELLIVRHGETEWSRAGRHTGSTDVPLTARGEAEARALAGVVAAALAGRAPAMVLTSPMGRAARTLALALPGASATVCADLGEYDYGAYEGRTSADIQRSRPGWNVWDHGCPGGETAAQVGDRADRVLARIAAAAGPVVVASHGHAGRILAARALGLSAADGRRFASDTGSLGVVADRGGERCVQLWNATGLTRPPEAPA